MDPNVLAMKNRRKTFDFYLSFSYKATRWLNEKEERLLPISLPAFIITPTLEPAFLILSERRQALKSRQLS